MQPPPLTDRQQRALAFIRYTHRRLGCGPTRQELARHLGMQPGNPLNQILRALQARGHVRLHPGTPRGIQPVNEGLPIHTLDDFPPRRQPPPHAELPPEVLRLFTRARPTHLLTVTRPSALGPGLYPGCLVAVAAFEQPVDGDVVVARVNANTFLRFRETETAYFLEEADGSPAFAGEDAAVLAVVVGALLGSPAFGPPHPAAR